MFRSAITTSKVRVVSRFIASSPSAAVATG